MVQYVSPTKPDVERATIFLDGIECANGLLPDDGPFYIVWGPGGLGPIRYAFRMRSDAERAANRMALRYADVAQVFYVATLLTWHQQQVGPVRGDVYCSGSSILMRSRRM